MKDQLAKLSRLRWAHSTHRAAKNAKLYYHLPNKHLVTVAYADGANSLEITSYDPQDNITDHPGITTAEEALAVLMMIEVL